MQLNQTTCKTCSKPIQYHGYLERGNCDNCNQPTAAHIAALIHGNKISAAAYLTVEHKIEENTVINAYRATLPADERDQQGQWLHDYTVDLFSQCVNAEQSQRQETKRFIERYSNASNRRGSAWKMVMLAYSALRPLPGINNNDPRVQAILLEGARSY